MKKLSAIALAIALTLGAASSFAKGTAYPACKDLKGKERSACIKSERAKKVEAKKEEPKKEEPKKDAKSGKDTATAPVEGSTK